jgi:RNA polymerase sigma-70 factor (ECF subfamily)
VGVSLIEATRSAGVQAWPGLELDDAALRGVLDPIADRDPPPHLADLYLVAGVLANRPAAVAAFEASQMPVVARTVRKLGGTAAEVDEVQQHVRTVVLVAVPGQPRALATFRGDGSLASWIRVVAMRETYRRLRARAAGPVAGDDQLVDLMTSPDPELGTMKASYRDQLGAAVRAAISALPRRERTALRLSVLDGVSIDAIGQMFGVHRATAARWLMRARELVQAETRAAMIAQLGIVEAELDSILRLIGSRLEISIATALGGRGS